MTYGEAVSAPPTYSGTLSVMHEENQQQITFVYSAPGQVGDGSYTEADADALFQAFLDHLNTFEFADHSFQAVAGQKAAQISREVAPAPSE